MRIILLGTGAPMLEPKRQASALLIETGGVKLLFDAGRGVTTQLVSVGIYPQQVDCAFITHHHYDHIGNLGEFLLSAWHNGRARPINLYGPPGTAEIVAALFDQVYARDIDFALFIEQGLVDIRELVLTHIRPKSEAMLRSMMQDVRREYDGKVYLGNDLMTIDV